MNGARLCEQALPRRDIAGDGARLDHGGALPVLADELVVVERRVGGDGEGGGAGVGAQAQVGAEHVAVLGALLQEAHEVARQPHQERLHLQAGTDAHARRVVEDDEVDIGGVVELKGAVLAHGEHDVARGLRCEPIALGLGLPEQEAYGRGDRHIGRLREAAGGDHHRPHAAYVAQRGEQRHLRLEATQDAHGVGICPGGIDCGPHLRKEIRKAPLGIARKDALQALRMALDQGGEIGRRAKDAGQQIAHAGLSDQLAKLGEADLRPATLRQVGKRAPGTTGIVNDRRCGKARVERPRIWVSRNIAWHAPIYDAGGGASHPLLLNLRKYL